MLRLLSAVLLVWLVVAAVAWQVVKPGDALVNARPPLATSSSWNLDPPRVDAALEQVGQVALWGVQRNGMAFAPPAPKQVEEETTVMADWFLVATAVRPKERYIVIQTSGEPPVTIKEGEKLPDGSTLEKVEVRAVTLVGEDGKKRVIETQVE